MTPTECLLDKRKSFHSIHTNILSAVWLCYFNVNRPCNRQGNLSSNTWLLYLAMPLSQTKRQCNLSLHSIPPIVTW